MPFSSKFNALSKFKRWDRPPRYQGRHRADAPPAAKAPAPSAPSADTYGRHRGEARSLSASRPTPDAKDRGGRPEGRHAKPGRVTEFLSRARKQMGLFGPGDFPSVDVRGPAQNLKSKVAEMNLPRPSPGAARRGLAASLAGVSVMGAAFGAGAGSNDSATSIPHAGPLSSVVQQVDEFQVAGGEVQVRIEPGRIDEPSETASLAVVTTLLETAERGENPEAVGEQFRVLTQAVAPKPEGAQPQEGQPRPEQIPSVLGTSPFSLHVLEVPKGTTSITDIPDMIQADPPPPEVMGPPAQKPEVGPLVNQDWLFERASDTEPTEERDSALVTTGTIEQIANVIEARELPTTVPELREYQRLRGLPQEGNFDSPAVARQMVQGLAGSHVLVTTDFPSNTAEGNAEELAWALGPQGVADLRTRLGVAEPTQGDIAQAAEKRGDELVDAAFIQALARELDRRWVGLGEEQLAQFRHANGLGNTPDMDPATAAALSQVASAPHGQAPGVDAGLLRSVMPQLSPELAQAYIPYLNQAMLEFHIDSPARVAAFLAQLAHESVQLRYFEEIASGAAYEGRDDLGNTQPGDGVRFKGRGPIQLTGRANYERASQALFGDDRMVRNPEIAEDPSVAFRIAGLYWQSRELNKYADAGDFDAITYRINGGYNGKADRDHYWGIARHALGGGLVLNAPVPLRG